MGTHALEIKVLIFRCFNIRCIILHVLVGLSWSLVSTAHGGKKSSGTIYYKLIQF
jgi:hypothetical protein